MRNTCWSFANEYFRKDHESDLVNIKRRQVMKGKKAKTPEPSTEVRLELTPLLPRV